MLLPSLSINTTDWSTSTPSTPLTSSYTLLEQTVAVKVPASHCFLSSQLYWIVSATSEDSLLLYT